MSGGAHGFFGFPGDQCQLIRWSLGVSTPTSQPHLELLMGLHLIRVIDPCSCSLPAVCRLAESCLPTGFPYHGLHKVGTT